MIWRSNNTWRIGQPTARAPLSCTLAPALLNVADERVAEEFSSSGLPACGLETSTTSCASCCRLNFTMWIRWSYGRPVWVIHEQGHTPQCRAQYHAGSWAQPHTTDPWQSHIGSQNFGVTFLVRMSILVSVVPGLKVALANSIEPYQTCVCYTRNAKFQRITIRTLV